MYSKKYHLDTFKKNFKIYISDDDFIEMITIDYIKKQIQKKYKSKVIVNFKKKMLDMELILKNV